MIKKIYSFFFIVLVLVTSPFLIRYLLANQKITILNSIYFNFPGIITKNKICPTYDALLNQTLDDSFSVSIINNKGEIISSYNEDVPRLPASNQKLFSSAYVLSKYKLNNNLKTSLFKNKNDYYLRGQGDPDLNYEHIIDLISNVKENKIINFNIVEIDSKLYWPNGWTNTDKLYEYGSPITSLAIESNHNKFDDIYALKNFIKNYLKNKFPNSKIYIDFFDSEKTLYLKNIKEINKVYSTPILSLLTLTNSESHNFTAESLFKNASNTWNDNNYVKLKRWLENKGLPATNAYFADASGLSRKNKITTKLVVLFLDKMRYFNDFKAYQSTLSITGVRGTLAKRFVNSELSGKFFGKTGTLSNVFALSGFLYKNEKPIIISIIQNSNKIDKEKAFNLLRDLYYLKSC
ncbi:D-alanyl-D-alanine carboxypeptidase [Prochlorococcus marinus XMU1414]|uniref:D-alanyl-D-alanine carboxypeptidase n=1 Tax=Prochlorococcus marinus XMU1424 TaxID=2774497 RepID=A0A9D9G386_PROMR|nr:D-alanyl-D-alanine carboxypeptidase [Prochlorococcus marinus]MBO8228218.1 D-alanyl-D-alanine carboxypeptidase [Prochlorococcus marinus XMU1414]MBW3045719.1 D-alanyl-D-alanine carboxypeptidase [Prochlorococcus marinus str. MU1414]MCR8532003.1 D-alanyl-D-alanine carboxypeptidase [Prochlorococcus marinus XMU1420]MCR8535530.1 D-alanyl-D-alanine carboxypeptidase [Prochlorococcus marinus XMU1424]